MPLSPGSLLTVAEAVREIGGNETATRAWLRDRRLVRDVPGLGLRVLWGKVLAAVEDDEPAPKKQPTMRRTAL